jgi:hypothetical protein
VFLFSLCFHVPPRISSRFIASLDLVFSLAQTNIEGAEEAEVEGEAWRSYDKMRMKKARTLKNARAATAGVAAGRRRKTIKQPGDGRGHGNGDSCLTGPGLPHAVVALTY